MARITETVDQNTLTRLQSRIFSHGLRETARQLSVNHETLSRIARTGKGSPVLLAKLHGKVATRDDFKAAPAEAAHARKRTPQLSWPLESIRAARDAQMLGDFRKSKPLADAMQSDDAIFVARNNRAAPLSALTARIKAAEGSRSEPVAKRAKLGVTVNKATLVGIGSTLAMFGVAFGYNRHLVNEDGTLTQFFHEEWPIESVWWDERRGTFLTTDITGKEIVITHADSRFTIYRKRELQPWLGEAAILALALVFAYHLPAIKSWASSANSHGQAHLMGELPQGIPIKDPTTGELSAEASAFLDMLTDIVSGEAGAGLRPNGAKTEFEFNSSSAWQVFKELVGAGELSAARILLGNNGQLGAVTSGPGVDVATLFGVATTKVQGDVEALQTGLYEGVYVPWTAINYGDSAFAPSYVFELPNDDEAQKKKQRKEAQDALFETLKAYKDNGCEVTQDLINTLAELYDVEPIPQLAGVETAVVPLTLAPTDVAKVVRVREARAAQGLPAFGDERDDLTITQLDAITTQNASASPVTDPAAVSGSPLVPPPAPAEPIS